MAQKDTVKAIAHRLMPLYIAAALQSFVLWYTIEKLFMHSIGFNNTTIGVMIAVYSAVMLLVDTPSGILADRWSRKGVLMIASVCMALSSLAGGFSYGIGTYLVCAILWGIFFACYQGVYDSIVYDTVAEMSPNSTLFDRLFGRLQVFESSSLVVSSILGALIAAQTNIRAVYFLTIPIVLAAIIALYKLKEPTLHKQHATISLPQQIATTFKAVTRNRELFPVVIVLIIRSTLIYCIFEFSQLWLLALHTPTVYYGFANAAVLASLGIGGILVSRLRLSRYSRVGGVLLILLLSCGGLIFLRNTVAIVIVQAVFAVCLVALFVIFSRILHDNIHASIRAGAASATSTMGRFVIIPISLLIGYLSQRFTIYTASYVLLILALLMSVFVMVVAHRNHRTGLEPASS